jgi:hypothetical protein
MATTLLSPEFKLMLSCCRVIPSKKELKHREEAFNNTIDEEAFWALVLRHRVFPIVHYNFQQEARLSMGLKEKLKQYSENNQRLALQSMLMQHRLQKELDKHGFKGFFLKGIKLSEFYYGDLGLRQVMDLDCWVEQSAIGHVTNWLYDQGYVSVPDIRQLNTKQLDFIKRTDHDLQFITEKSGLPNVIELHWKLRGPLGGFNLTPDKPMNEVDNFLYLCAHGTEHGWFRMKWLFDLPQIMDRLGFDWAQVRDRAIVLDCLEHLEITMMVLESYLNESIPAVIMNYLNPSTYTNQLSYIHGAISSASVFNDNDTNRLAYLRYMSSLSRKKINWALILKYLTSQKDWEMLHLPSSLFFLYFPLRPFLVLWRRIFEKQ